MGEENRVNFKTGERNQREKERKKRQWELKADASSYITAAS